MLQRFPVTFGLCLMVVAAFLGQALLGGTMDPETMLRMGALRADRLVVHWELYRLFTSMFLHVGPLHIILNGIALFQLALLTEWLYGSERTLAFYLVCGLMGALGSAALMTPYLVAGSVGASGAIMGLAGLIFGLQLYGAPEVRDRLNEMLGYRLAFGIGLTFAIGIGVQIFLLPFIDNWCHAAGFFTGMFLAWSYPDPNAAPERRDQIAAGALTTVVLVAFAWAGVDGHRALDTYDIDAATSFEHRLAEQDDGAVAAMLSEQMVQSYRDADSPNTGTRALEAALARFESADTLSTLAGLIYNNGWDTENQMVLERWLELAPEDPLALNAHAWLLVTLEDETARDPARALPISSRSLELIGGWEDEDEHRAAFLDTRGEILLQLDRLEEAHVAQVEAVRLARARSIPVQERIMRAVGLIGPPVLDELEKRLETIEGKLET